MLQQDLLDTLFLNRKALAGVGGGETSGAGNDHHTNDNNTQVAHTTTVDGGRSSITALTMNKDMGGPDAAAAAAGGEEKCPVDHRSREAWMAQAKAAQEQAQTSSSSPPRATTPQAPSNKPTSSTWQWPRIPFLPSSSSSSSTSPSTTTKSLPPPSPHGAQHEVDNTLGTDRVISTIPRSQSPGATSSACPVNHETETGADAKTGNWVYPSEKMFFDAMKRKGHDTRAGDMKTVVPIHNAVNERAWKEIREWERPYASETYVFSSCRPSADLYICSEPMLILLTTAAPKAQCSTPSQA